MNMRRISTALTGALLLACTALSVQAATHSRESNAIRLDTRSLPENVLGEALNVPELDWSTGGHADWFAQSAVSRDGQAAQSGAITHNQQSWMQTTVTGPGTISFWWKVSSENNYDFLRFHIGSMEQARISGNVDWQQRSFEVPTGTHTLKWQYDKDGSVTHGSDCGWVDQVVWQQLTSYTLTVRSTNPFSGVSITSGTGHGGSTQYTQTLEQNTSVSLTAPEYHGSGASRKRFESWSGSVSNTNRTITVPMNADRTVTANYVDDPESEPSTDMAFFFLSDQSGTYNIWRARYDGNSLHSRQQLTSFTDLDVDAYDIHQESGKIALVVKPTDSHIGVLYTMNMDGTGLALVPNLPAQGVGRSTVAWSPDGGKIAFPLSASQSTSQNLTIATIRPDGTDYEVLISSSQPRGSATHKFGIAWRGNHLYFGDTRFGSIFATMFELYRLDLHDSTFTNLTNTGSVGERFPVLSPSGEKLAFETLANTSTRVGRGGISVMPVTGGTQTEMISRHDDSYATPRTWLSEDKIVFDYSLGTEKWQIYSMNATDGGNKQNLSNNPDYNERHARFISLSADSQPVASIIPLRHWFEGSRVHVVVAPLRISQHAGSTRSTGDAEPFQSTTATRGDEVLTRDGGSSVGSVPQVLTVTTDPSTYLVQNLEVVMTSENDRVPLASTLLFDSSGSMNSNDPGRLRVTAGKDFVDRQYQSDLAAVMDFGAGSTQPFAVTRLLQDFTFDKQALRNAMDRVTASSGTPLYQSLAETIGHMSNSIDRDVFAPWLLLFADGEPNNEAYKNAALTALAETSTPVISVGLGPASDRAANSREQAVAVMRELAEETSGVYIGLNDASQISSVFGQLADGLMDGQVKISFDLEPELAPGETVTIHISTTQGNFSVTVTGEGDTPGGSTINAELRDLDGNAAVPSQSRIVLNPGNVIRAGQNPAVFADLDAGVYSIRGYHRGPFDEFELWGATEIELGAGESASVDIERVNPYAQEVVWKKASDGSVIAPSDSVGYGTEIRAEVTVRSRVPDVFLTGRMRLMARIEGDTFYDQLVSYPALPGGATSFAFDLAPAAAGRMSFAVKVYTTLDSAQTLTDSWDWVDVFEVEEPTAVQPELSWTDEIPSLRYTAALPNPANPESDIEFRIKYTDADGDEPEAGSFKLHVLDGDGNPIGGSPFAMTPLNNDPVEDGRIYGTSIGQLALGLDYTYHFEVRDVNGNEAVGAPTGAGNRLIVQQYRDISTLSNPNIDHRPVVSIRGGLARGSGFLIAPGYVLTNYHVLAAINPDVNEAAQSASFHFGEECDPEKVVQGMPSLRDPFHTRSEVVYFGGTFVAGERVGVGVPHAIDWAIVRINDWDHLGTPFGHLEPVKEFQGVSAIAIGHPDWYDLALMPGDHLDSAPKVYTETGEVWEVGYEDNYWLTAIGFRGGNSGGPVFCSDTGKVFGIATSEVLATGGDLTFLFNGRVHKLDPIWSEIEDYIGKTVSAIGGNGETVSLSTSTAAMEGGMQRTAFTPDDLLIEVVDLADIAPIPDYEILFAVDITPDGTTFNPAATLRVDRGNAVRYDSITDEAVIFKYRNGTWQALETLFHDNGNSDDLSDDFWTASVTSLSVFAFGVPAASLIAQPAFDPDGGEHPNDSVAVTVTCATDGATIRYTVGSGATPGADPTETSTVVPANGIVDVPVPGWLKARAWKDGMVASHVKTTIYMRIIHALTYTAGANGSIDGEPEVVQTVAHGDDGEEVTAVPDPGYRFVQWSDGATPPARTDTNIVANLNVNAEFEPKLVPTIVWPEPAAIVYGAALDGTQLNAEADTAGAFVYDTPVGAILGAGVHAIGASFIPTDGANWAEATAVATIEVAPAPLTCIADDKAKVVGSPNPPLTVTYVGLVNADAAPANPPTVSCAADAESPAGDYDIVLAGGHDPNYTLTLHNGTLTVVQGGAFYLRVESDQASPIELVFGEVESAEEGLDALDVPAEEGQHAYLRNRQIADPAKQALARDFRPIPDDGPTRWRLEVGAPSLPRGGSVHPDGVASPETRAERSETGHPTSGSEAANLNPVEEEAGIRLRRETSYTLTWNVDAADTGREVWLQQIDALERPVGFPLDMKALDELPGVSPGTVFEIVYGALQTHEIPLARGWNAVGTPLLTTVSFAQVCATAGTAVASPAWRWHGGGFEQTPDDEPFLPKTGYLVRSDADAATLTVTGLPPNPILPPPTGWQLASPVETTPLGDDRSGNPPAWRWDAERQVYRAKDSLQPGRAYWRHDGEAATNPEPSGGDYLVIDVSAGPDANSYPVSYMSSVPAGGWTDAYKTTKIVLRRIPAGTFIMGSPGDELGRLTDGREDQRSVTLTRDFYIGVFQVTQKQWERVMGNWPSYFSNTDYRDARPVEQVSWNDVRGGTWPGSPAGSGQPAAGTFIRRLRDRTGLTFDLPTEAQWEYACRADTTKALNAPWDNGGRNLEATGECPNMSAVGRYRYNHPGGYSSSSSVDTSGGTAKVGSYLPNQWGLYDMHGNVWEWCLDWYVTSPASGVDPLGASTGSGRVYRGGGWNNFAQFCRSAIRYWSNPDYRFDNFGFRVCSAPPGQ